MQVTEAADVIDEIISSLKRNPDQFEPSFSVIGNDVTLSDVTIETARKKEAPVFDEQFNFLLQDLREIADQLRSPSPDKLLIQEILASFRGSWIPGVIIGVVGNVVSKASGF